MILVRGKLVHAEYMGSSEVIVHTIQDAEGGRHEVLAMEVLGPAGSEVEIPVNVQVRKRKDGTLQDQTSIWAARERRQQSRRQVAGFEVLPENMEVAPLGIPGGTESGANGKSGFRAGMRLAGVGGNGSGVDHGQGTE